MDEVIAGYRELTGKAPIMPKWAYGFWQSRQRYETQDQLLGVLHEYRKRGLPLDNIVQDWLYWPQDAWGCQCFDPARFPDPKAMVDDVHASGAHVMISVWAKYYQGHAELQGARRDPRHATTACRTRGRTSRRTRTTSNGCTSTGSARAISTPSTIPTIRRRATSTGARSGRASRARASTPGGSIPTSRISTRTSRPPRPRGAWVRPQLGPAEPYFNSYPLVHVDGVYDHQIADKPDVRPFILTRSAFGGIQRDSAAVWSGDVASRWDNLREQISAGLNFSMSGDPNWSHDIGGYTMEPRFLKPTPADLAEWRELNTRWFQFGAFSPIFRSHGENIKREIFEMSPAGSPTYKFDGLVRPAPLPADALYLHARRRHLLQGRHDHARAGDGFRRATSARGASTTNICSGRRSWSRRSPSTRRAARKVYLPAGATWYDFYTGRSTTGGQTITAAAPYERMPLFVRAGSIVPTGPAIQYTGNNSHSPVTLNVYTGANGSFSLYEDDGVSRQYLHGQYSRIPLQVGRADEDADHRRARGQWLCRNGGRARDQHPLDEARQSARARHLDAKADATVTYSGTPLTVRMR